MSVKYQVFVSSTYKDLVPEREQVVKAILEMGHIPVGMEMFSAADEAQWKVITRQIDQSDYYVILVAHRYGSMVDGVSYTEKEYDYAVKQGVPTLGFVVDKSIPWDPQAIDQDPDVRAALEQFRKKVMGKPVGFWKSKEDLHGKVSIALIKTFNTNPRPGWMRTTDVPGPELAQELVRLSKENDALRAQLTNKAEAAEKATKQTILGTFKSLRSSEEQISVYKRGARGWESGRKANMLAVFYSIAPTMFIEASTYDIARTISGLIRQSDEVLREHWPIPSNAVQAMLAELYGLDLVTPSNVKHGIKDQKEYWTLTENGRATYGFVRHMLKSSREDTSNQPESPVSGID